MTDTPLEHTGRQVKKEILCDAPADVLYDAWLRPEHITGWFADTVSGGTEVGDTQEWAFDGFPVKMPYEIVVAEPGRRLVLKCDMPERGVGLVEIVLEQEGGRTRMRLINSGFESGAEWDEEYEGVDSGWEMALAILREYAEKHFGEARRTHLAMQAGTFGYPDVLPFFRTSAGLARWLTRSGTIGEVGDPVRLELQGGATLTGRVLSRTDWETALSWDEIGGSLELKAFACAGPRAVALRCTGWGIDDARFADLSAWADAATARLLPLVEHAAGSAQD